MSVLIGLFFVFFKLNVSFLDIGVTYYLTNIIGYSSIFLGVRELERKYQRISKVQPYVIFMIFHSIIFFLLNITGHSPLTIPMFSYMAVISLVGLGFVIVGMFMVFVIISHLIEQVEEETSGVFKTSRLKILCVAMMMIFVLAGICYFFFPVGAQILMAILLILKFLFLVEFYSVFLRNMERIIEQN